ncbi:MAG: excinuclease ABC subunit UvrA [Flavobacteriales bacterium]|nr:excinuclease ABC subunit UvrA [Flavobacteriales bacterium]MCX7769359.1 excinuclease ABC subunit UvrA [Flavobacteriales bacterium]MDW8410751.1 excinuclease ABC subunit UvrA [Flavobacteriales bacterium]
MSKSTRLSPLKSAETPARSNGSQRPRVDTPEYIEIIHARTHNLRNVTVRIPHGRFTVITGVSGSGKSSLAFHTLFAEGQRRYVESLSSYARQFLGRIERPDVDDIVGLSPTVAIEQKVVSANSRSTVGTATEIYDYLKLLFARVGRIYSPISGKEVKRHSPGDVVSCVQALPIGTRCLLVVPFPRNPERSLERDVELLLAQGFNRLFDGRSVVRLEDWEPSEDTTSLPWLLIDRFVAGSDDGSSARFADSAETAMYEGRGECVLFVEKEGRWEKHASFSDKLEADGVPFEPPSVHLFNFNSPVGACSVCEGFGWTLGIDEDLVIPDQSRSVYDDAVACWKGETLSWWKDQFIRWALKLNFPIHKPYIELTEKERRLLWEGREGKPYGIWDFFADVESQLYKIQYRVLLSRYRGRTTCKECRGTGLRKEASYVKVAGYSLHDLLLMPVAELRTLFDTLQLNPHEEQVARHILQEIRSRLRFLCDVGLGYLTLHRRSRTLSGGETQRIQLATALGSSLTGATYILDEPSIGLHSRDTHRLIETLRALRDEDNTLVVVEHDRDIIEAADHLIDMGPEAGWKGGQVVYSGPASDVCKATTLTADYLCGRRQIPVPRKRRIPLGWIKLYGARGHNLKNIDFSVPLGVLSGVSGVSGSGKSTLVKKIFYPAIARHLGQSSDAPLPFRALEVPDSPKISGVELVDQEPAGSTSRSNPITYLKIFDEIRALFAEQPAARRAGLSASHFSFNMPGGRCEECQGEGHIVIEMQFMADVKLLCEACGGRRYKEEILDVQFQGKNIADVLEMTVDEAVSFFSQYDQPITRRIVERFAPLQAVGLDYIRLGQPASTLSGGEAQRVKLAFFLSRAFASRGPTLFIFDEPTTGLHFHDIHKLLNAFAALLQKGHSILVIEHNLDVLKCCDYITDLGPEGGPSGGYVVASGTPEEIAACPQSYTGHYLSRLLS